MAEEVLGYRQFGDGELEATALAGIFREWADGWRRNLAAFERLPDDIKSAILNGPSDFESGTTAIMASWMTIHPDIQRRHLSYMEQAEATALRLVSARVGTVPCMDADGMQARIDELERENRRLCRFVDAARELLGEALVESDEHPLGFVVQPTVGGDCLEHGASDDLAR